ASLAAAGCNVVATALSGDVGELLVPPEVIQSLQAAIELGPIRLPIPEILLVNRQNVGNVDLVYVARLARRAILGGDIFRKFAFCCFNFALSASCGDMLAAVENDPGCVMLTFPVPACWTEPEPGAFTSTRHNSLIRSM